MRTNEEKKASTGFRLHPFAIFVIVLGVLGTMASSPVRADSDVCVMAQIDQQVRLPHGEMLSPGLLRICQGKLSPVSHLHRTTMNGRPVGLLMSRTKTTVSESQDYNEPVVVFHRTDDGNLELVGLIVPGNSHSVSHWFVRHGRPVTTKVRVSEPQILIAAAMN